MAQDYTIEAVSSEVKNIPTKFGNMLGYKMKFVGMAEPVEVLQKPESPAPVAGASVYGTVSDTQYGKKFKREQQQPGFGGGFGGGAVLQAPTLRSSSNNFQSDPFTMYLSYAKDIAAAMITAKTYDQEKYAALLEDVLLGGKVLYDGRPGAPEQAEQTAKPTTEDVAPTDLDPATPDEWGEVHTLFDTKPEDVIPL